MAKLAKNKKLLVITASALVIGTLCVGAYLLIFNTASNPSSTASTSQEEDVKAVQEGESAKNPSAQTGGNDKQNPQASSSNGPAIPSGSFVSSHRPRTTDDTIESSCITSVGASCEIVLTSNGTTKSLGVKATDQGAAYWLWTPSQLGLTSGQWQVIAKATYNNKEVEQTDPLMFLVP